MKRLEKIKRLIITAVSLAVLILFFLATEKEILITVLLIMIIALTIYFLHILGKIVDIDNIKEFSDKKLISERNSMKRKYFYICRDGEYLCFPISEDYKTAFCNMNKIEKEYEKRFCISYAPFAEIKNIEDKNYPYKYIISIYSFIESKRTGKIIKRKLLEKLSNTKDFNLSDFDLPEEIINEASYAFSDWQVL